MSSIVLAESRAFIRPIDESHDYIPLDESDINKIISKHMCANCGGTVYNIDLDDNCAVKHFSCSGCGRTTVIHK